MYVFISHASISNYDLSRSKFLIHQSNKIQCALKNIVKDIIIRCDIKYYSNAIIKTQPSNTARETAELILQLLSTKKNKTYYRENLIEQSINEIDKILDHNILVDPLLPQTLIEENYYAECENYYANREKIYKYIKDLKYQPSLVFIVTDEKFIHHLTNDEYTNPFDYYIVDKTENAPSLYINEINGRTIAVKGPCLQLHYWLRRYANIPLYVGESHRNYEYYNHIRKNEDNLTTVNAAPLAISHNKESYRPLTNYNMIKDGYEVRIYFDAYWESDRQQINIYVQTLGLSNLCLIDNCGLIINCEYISTHIDKIKTLLLFLNKNIWQHIRHIFMFDNLPPELLNLIGGLYLFT
jgi:hypothetical protein